MILVTAALTLSLSGCGGEDVPETAEVSGVVLYKGQPVENAEINFYPKDGHPATARTGPDGRFVLTTYNANDGAVPGTHTVTVQLFPAEALPGMETQSTGAAEIPAKYGSPSASPLTVQVKPDEDNDLTLELED